VADFACCKSLQKTASLRRSLRWSAGGKSKGWRLVALRGSRLVVRGAVVALAGSAALFKKVQVLRVCGCCCHGSKLFKKVGASPARARTRAVWLFSSGRFSDWWSGASLHRGDVAGWTRGTHSKRWRPECNLTNSGKRAIIGM